VCEARDAREAHERVRGGIDAPARKAGRSPPAAPTNRAISGAMAPTSSRCGLFPHAVLTPSPSLGVGSEGWDARVTGLGFSKAVTVSLVGAVNVQGCLEHKKTDAPTAVHAGPYSTL